MTFFDIKSKTYETIEVGNSNIYTRFFPYEESVTSICCMNDILKLPTANHCQLPRSWSYFALIGWSWRLELLRLMWVPQTANLFSFILWLILNSQLDIENIFFIGNILSNLFFLVSLFSVKNYSNCCISAWHFFSLYW